MKKKILLSGGSSLFGQTSSLFPKTHTVKVGSIEEEKERGIKIAVIGAPSSQREERVVRALKDMDVQIFSQNHPLGPKAIGQAVIHYDVKIDNKYYRRRSLKDRFNIKGGLFKKISGVNIISEFILIQEKKSKLSKSLRDLVEYKFNCDYEEID